MSRPHAAEHLGQSYAPPGGNAVTTLRFEHDWLRVYRHRGAAQTIPILEERTA